MIEQSLEKKDLETIPAAVIMIGLTPVVAAIPVAGGILAFMIGLVAVIIILTERKRMASTEKRAFYYSILCYILGVVASVIGIFAMVFQVIINSSTHSIAPADIQEYVNLFIPYAAATAVFSELAYLLLPFGLSSHREKFFLYLSFAVALAFSFSSLYLMRTGYFKIASVPSSSSAFTGIGALSNSLIARAMEVPGMLLWLISYAIIGRRLMKDTTE